MSASISSASTRPHAAFDPLSKVAAVTFSFWVMKILATTLGETAGDFLSMTLNLGYYTSFAITFAALAVVLIAQIRSNTFNPVLFWLAIIATTTAGTEVSDMMDRSFGLGYAQGTAILLAGLAISLGVWFWSDRSLRVYPIKDRRVEAMFWIAVLFSNSLGTAFGDFLTDNMSLGYLGGALVTSAIIGLVVLLHYRTRLNDVLLFWVAFIFTRPFGATFGDLLTKPLAKGGFNLPRETASLVTLGLLIGVLYLSVRRNRAQEVPA